MNKVRDMFNEIDVRAILAIRVPQNPQIGWLGLTLQIGNIVQKWDINSGKTKIQGISIPFSMLVGERFGDLTFLTSLGSYYEDFAGITYLSGIYYEVKEWLPPLFALRAY